MADASGSQTQIVTLTQLHYSMIISGLENTELELGGTYKATIRTNANWEVVIGGATGLIEDYTTEGNANIFGTDFSFTLTDNDAFEGQTASITFKDKKGSVLIKLL